MDFSEAFQSVRDPRGFHQALLQTQQNPILEMAIVVAIDAHAQPLGLRFCFEGKKASG